VRVLVVEDDSLIREIVVEALQDAGFDVIQARDGEEALTWCRQRVADVLITDIRLPGRIDGWEIAGPRARPLPSSDLRDRLLAGGGPSGAGQLDLVEAVPSGARRPGRQGHGQKTTGLLLRLGPPNFATTIACDYPTGFHSGAGSARRSPSRQI